MTLFKGQEVENKESPWSRHYTHIHTTITQKENKHKVVLQFKIGFRARAIVR